MSTTKENLSVVIVNYNSTKYLNDLLLSMKPIMGRIKEIIVIDNNSIDLEDLIRTEKVKIILNKVNIGFAAAVNQGITKSSSRYILLINPDCLIIDKSIFKSLNYLSVHKNKVAAIGGKILDSRHKTIHSANSKPDFFTALFEFTILKKIFYNNIFSRKFWIKVDVKINKPFPVFCLCGAFILLQKKFFSYNILLDESYFMYLEDVDLGFRLESMGAKVMFDPRTQIIHKGGKSNTSKYGIVLNYWYKSRLILFNKILPKYQSYIISLLFRIEEVMLFYYHRIKHEPTE